jgi:hypothetical protein
MTPPSTLVITAQQYHVVVTVQIFPIKTRWRPHVQPISKLKLGF